MTETQHAEAVEAWIDLADPRPPFAEYMHGQELAIANGWPTA